MSALAVQPSPKPVIRRSIAEGLLTCRDFVMEDSERLAFGSAIHSFAANYWHQCQATREETRQTDVARLAAEAWAVTDGLAHGRFDEFVRLAERFAETHTANLEQLYSVEETLTLDVGFAMVTCTIDRQDRIDIGDPDDEPIELQITDYKSEISEMDHTFQIRWYTEMRFRTMPSLQRIRFLIDPIRWGVNDADVDEFKRGDLAGWFAVQLEKLQLCLRKPLGNPRGGPACEGCAKRYSCSKALTHAAAIPENEDQADELFQEMLRFEAAYSERKKGLAQFYADREMRVVAGKELGFLIPRDPHLVVTAKPLAIAKWLNKKHMDGEAALKVNPRAIDNRALQDQLVEAGLAKREYSRPAFKWRNYLPAREARRAKQLQNTEEETTDE